MVLYRTDILISFNYDVRSLSLSRRILFSVYWPVSSVVTALLSVWEVWGSIPVPVKSNAVSNGANP